MAKPLRFRGLDRAEILGRRVPVARTLASRTLGLAFLRRERAGEGLLIPSCRSIHTFGMRFEIDVFFLDSTGRVIDLRREVPPRRTVRHAGAAAVLELPSSSEPRTALAGGTATTQRTKPADSTYLVPCPAILDRMRRGRRRIARMSEGTASGPRSRRGSTDVMRLLILAEVSLYQEALAQSLGRDERFDVSPAGAELEEVLAGLEDVRPDIILVDARMPASTNAVRVLAAATPEVKVVAFGVPEVQAEVMALAEAGASGYVALDGSMEDLTSVVESVSRGETLCSPVIAATLFRRVAALARERQLEPIEEKLTAREVDVLRLIEEGLSNKEIAAALLIELPTVKNHVHRILEKLNVHRRTEAAARARRDGFAHLGGLESTQAN